VLADPVDVGLAVGIVPGPVAADDDALGHALPPRVASRARRIIRAV
jgi:hypothetical protein